MNSEMTQKEMAALGLRRYTDDESAMMQQAYQKLSLSGPIAELCPEWTAEQRRIAAGQFQVLRWATDKDLSA